MKLLRLIKAIALCLALLFFASILFCAETAKNLADVHSAGCRVVCSKSGSRSGSIGSGTVVALTDNRYWILTNWHVVDGFNDFRLEFFRDGRIFAVSGKLEGSWHNERAPWDFAIITVNQRELAPYNPPIVPLAGESVKPLLDKPIYSSGCSEGRWAAAWKGSVESYYGETAQFYPAPKSGQSGSAIVQEIGGQLRVTGVLTWRVGDERKLPESEMRGGAIPIALFYQAVQGRRPTGDSDSIPPFSTWAGESGELKVESGDNSTLNSKLSTFNILKMGSDEYFDAPASDYSHLVLYCFVSANCSPCEVAKPVITRLQNEGYQCQLVDTTPEIQEQCGVMGTPTFILATISGENASELTRWEGPANLYERAKQVFSKYGVNSPLPPAPVMGDSPTITPGNVKPLLDLYSGGDLGGNGGGVVPTPTNPIPPQRCPTPGTSGGGLFGLRPPAPSNPPSSDTLLGKQLIEGLAGGIASSAQNELGKVGDKATDSLAKLDKTLETNITQLRKELVSGLLAFLRSVILWAIASFVSLYWGLNWILAATKLLVSRFFGSVSFFGKITTAVLDEIRKQ